MVKHLGKKFLSLFLVFVFVFGFLPDTRKIICAAAPVKYLDYNYETKLFEEKICSDYNLVGTGENTWRSGWYVVNQNLANGNRIKVNGIVNLILCNNCTFDSRNGINVAEGNTLNIYAQTEDDGIAGKLYAVGDTFNAGIGGNEGESGGTITINGGTINAKGQNFVGAGIGGGGSGGGNGGAGGIITINGGKVEAIGADCAAGIGGGGSGGGNGGAGGEITINGRAVTATGTGSGAGIGGGGSKNNSSIGGSGGIITINDGTVEVSGDHGAGIGGGLNGASGTIIINDGTINAESDTGGAGIGGGQHKNGEFITINGGIITATGGYDAAGIGGGQDGNSGVITINGGTITAISNYHGAGIGGGFGGAGETITINYGEITSTGKNGGAGIGGGQFGNGGKIKINNGTIMAKGEGGAGIGGGSGSGNGGTTMINGGVVTAIGENESNFNGGSGIGGGYYGNGGEITIDGGVINAIGGNGGAGIGGGLVDGIEDEDHGSGGNVIINSGIVTAIGGEGAMGIGHGKGSNNNGKLEISSGIHIFGDDDKNPPTTLVSKGPQENISERKRCMATVIAPVIGTQPVQTSEIFYGQSDARITGVVLSNEKELETVTYQWYTNTRPNNENGVAIDGATNVDYQIPMHGKETGTYYYYCVIKNTIADGRATETTSDVVTVEIKKAKPSYAVPHFTTKLGKTLKDLDLPKPENGNFSWVENINTSVGNIGDNIFHVDLTPNDTKNYEIVENIEVIVTVTEKTPQILEFEKDIISKTYGDETFSQLVSGAATEVTYSTDNADVADINVSNGAVTIKGVGKATITANTKETDEYATAKAEYILEVNAKKISVKADNKLSKVGENLVELTYTSDTLIPGDKFTGTLETYADKNKAGTYKISQGTLTPGDNYKIEFTPGVYTVMPVFTPQPSPNPQSGGGRISWNVITPSTITEIVGSREINASQNTNSINKKTLKDITLPYELKTRKYINGYEDKTFKPEQNITRAEVAQAIYKLINKGESIIYDVLAKFNDVETGKWYSKAIAYLAEKNVINGSDGKYNPEYSITRSETAQILLNVLESYDTGEKDYAYGSNPYDFGDINGWYSETVKQLASNGMINGYDDKTFKPNEKIKRSEFVAMIAKVFGRNVEDTSDATRFPDVPSDYWPAKFINNAAE